MAVPDPAAEGGPRLAEILAAVSLLTDLGMGQQPGEALRAAVLAVRLGERLGLDSERLSDTYYTTLLRHIGCTATAAAEAERFGADETLIRPSATVADFTSPLGVAAFLASATAAVPPPHRLGLARRLAASGHFGTEIQQATCEVAAALARRIGLPDAVCAGLHQQFERWDGRGEPDGLSGDGVLLSGRIAVLAGQAVRLAIQHGTEHAVETLRRRGGRLGPGLVAEFTAHAPDLFAAPVHPVEEPVHPVAAPVHPVEAPVHPVEAPVHPVEAPVASAGLPTGPDPAAPDDPYQAALDAEPPPVRRLTEVEVDRVAVALADLTDLKSPSLHGHSRGVANLAEHAAASGDRVLVRHAALLHDLGRIAVPAHTWERPGPLPVLDREAVQLHAYHGERALARCAAFRAAAALVGRHHERLDGSGYHRQARGSDLPFAARLLAAADAYHAMTEPRPHRPPLRSAAAAAELEREAEAGRLDPRAVRAVLHAAGSSAHRRTPNWPDGLSDREVEVLRLLARGASNRDIAERLTISPRTAEHHVEHIYAKTGCSSRPAAALFAMEHGLLG